MTFAQIEILSLIFMILCLFFWGRWRYDIVAGFGLLAAFFLGLVPGPQLFSGFAHPATVTVMMVLILSYGLSHAGAVDRLTELVTPLSPHPKLQILVLILLGAGLSMFMNNIGALALLMPVALQIAKAGKYPPGRILMPLSFGSILGGMTTLIGTPPNIIVSGYREKTVGYAYQMFDFSPVGGTIALAGIFFLGTIGLYLVKVRATKGESQLFSIESYLFEAKITKDSAIVEKTIQEFEEILSGSDVSLITLIHKQRKYTVPPKKHILQAGDLLVLEGPHEEVDKFVSKLKLPLLSAENAQKAVFDNSDDSIIVEAVIAPGSRLEDQTIHQIKFRSTYKVNVLGIFQKGRQHAGKLRHVKMGSGDVLLLHGDEEYIQNALSKLNCYPLAKRQMKLGKRHLAIPALLVFMTAVLAASLGLAPITVTLGCAIGVMVLFNIMPLKELYDGVDWPIIVLLGAMIPIGQALETTGGTDLISHALLGLTGSLPPYMILALIMIITMTLSDILNNAATAILMSPIAFKIAQILHLNPDPLLMGVAVGASCAFLTPIGHQNNVLIMNAGGYRFQDYWRMGLPLEILIILLGVPLITTVWPF